MTTDNTPQPLETPLATIPEALPIIQSDAPQVEINVETVAPEVVTEIPPEIPAENVAEIVAEEIAPVVELAQHAEEKAVGNSIEIDGIKSWMTQTDQTLVTLMGAVQSMGETLTAILDALQATASLEAPETPQNSSADVDAPEKMDQAPVATPQEQVAPDNRPQKAREKAARSWM